VNTRAYRAAAVGAGAALLLVGCAPDPAPSDPVVQQVEWHTEGAPDVLWPNGLPDDGRWADDEWVAAYRQFELLVAVGMYMRDYSDPGFVALVGGEFAPEFDVSVVSDEGRGFEYFPGPAPSIVLGVDEDGDQAVVSVCRVKGWGYGSDEDFRNSPVGQVKGQRAEITVQRDGDHLIIAKREYWLGLCDLEGVRVGEFDPPPPYGEPFDYLSILGVDGEPYWYTFIEGYPEAKKWVTDPTATASADPGAGG
jgi:hypothetical protein